VPAASQRTIVDTGPLVAALNANDEHHEWAREVFGQIHPPLLTCEAVLSETQFLLQDRGGDPLIVLDWVKRGVISLDFTAAEEIERIIQLQRSYRSLPMDFADACLVRMTELHERSRVLTTDSHFLIFRRNGRQLIPLLNPPGL
jgi:predicted nucleic acid-binding protein